MKFFFAIVLTMLLLLAGCSSNTKSTPDDSAEPTITTTDCQVTPSDVSESSVSLNDQEFDLSAFIDQVLFDTKKAPKMNIRIDDEDFYADINDALKIRDVLDIQSWKPVSSDDPIPYHEIKSPISLRNGNHNMSEISIDPEYNTIFVIVYDTNGPQGADNVRQYPYRVGEQVVKDIQALVEEFHTNVN